MPTGPAWVAQAAAMVPIALIVVFIGLLWLIGLACGKDRRTYVTTLSRQAMNAVTGLLHSPPSPSSPQPRNSLVPRPHGRP